MPSYKIEFAPAALRSLRKLDREAARRIHRAVGGLRTNPRPAGVKAVKLMPGVLRLRVGDYRILYQVDDSALVVLVIEAGHRREIYER